MPEYSGTLTRNPQGLSYQDQLTRPEWQVYRSEQILKAQGRCQDCRRVVIEWLTIHHCYYLSNRMIWDHPPELVMVLCWPCHKKRQEIEEAIHVALAKRLRDEPLDMLEKIAWVMTNAAIQDAKEDR